MRLLLQCDEASDTNHPVTEWHIRQERRRQMHCSESVKAHPNTLCAKKKKKVIHYSRTRCKTFMEEPFVITHTIRHTEIPALLDGWVKYMLSKCCAHKNKIASPYIYVKTLTCLCVGLLKYPSSFFLCLL